MFERYRKSLNECFSLLRKIKNNPEGEIRTVNTLQLKLLERIVECEARVRKTKKERSEIKASFGNKDARLTKEQAIAAKKRLKTIETHLETIEKLMWIYRDIGDGIAYTYISPFDIKPLAFKQSPGFISGKKGTRLERKILRAGNVAVDMGIVLIMNDLTNCLRYGDITLAGSDQILKVFECKSGKSKNKTERDKRQLANVEKMMSYLQNNITDTLYGEQGEFKRTDMHANPRRNTYALNKIIHDSKEKGTAAINPEPHLAYLVSRDGNFDPMNEIVKDWEPGFMFSSVNEAKYANIGYYPFPLLLDDPFPFYNGEYVIAVAFDVKAFEAYLRQNGIEPIADHEIGQLPDAYAGKYTFSMKSKEGVYSSWSYHFIGRLFYEFISADWFFKEAVNGMNEIVETAREKGLIPETGVSK